LYNHEYKDDFNELSSMIKTQKPKLEDFAKTSELVQYHVYDCFTGDPQACFIDRWKMLNQVLRTVPPGIAIVPTATVSSQQEIDDEYELYVAEGYEGQMIRIDSAYENKRTWNLLKRKEFITEEFVINRIEEGKGNWSGCAKRVFFSLPDGREFKATPKGTQKFLAKVLANKDYYVGKKGTVKFFNYTPHEEGSDEGGKPRFGVVTELDVQDK
jgi:DNA ligase-1